MGGGVGTVGLTDGAGTEGAAPTCSVLLNTFWTTVGTTVGATCGWGRIFVGTVFFDSFSFVASNGAHEAL